MGKGNRRADGTLRPSVVRRRARKNGTSTTFVDQAVVARFRTLTVARARIWNSYTLRSELGLDTTGLGARLEALADEHRWSKCRDTEGVVRAIGLPTNHPDLHTVPFEVHRDAMLARVVASVRETAAA